jgi:hypothetical protein
MIQSSYLPEQAKFTIVRLYKSPVGSLEARKAGIQLFALDKRQVPVPLALLQQF